MGSLEPTHIAYLGGRPESKLGQAWCPTMVGLQQPALRPKETYSIVPCGAVKLLIGVAGDVGQRRRRAVELGRREDNPKASARPQDFDPQPIALKLCGGFSGDQQSISNVADLSLYDRMKLMHRSGQY